MLVVINVYTLSNGNGWWYIKIALPIVAIIYLIINLLLSVRFLKTNRFIKTSIILFLINLFTYLPPLLINVNNPLVQKDIDDMNVLKANLFSWKVDGTLENNIHLIIFLTLLLLNVIFLVVGLIKKQKGEK